MKANCILIPSSKGNPEEVSKLYLELANLTGDEKIARELWALTQISEFMSTLTDIEYDENGDPTIKSYSKAINILEYLKDNRLLGTQKKLGGITDNKGNDITFKTIGVAMKKALLFNRNNPDMVATVVPTNNGYIISAHYKDSSNSEEPAKLEFKDSLCNKLRGILRKIGFDVAVDPDSEYDGVFNPLNAETTAEGLKTIIKIAKGELGELAFPEEFSHVMIAGLHNHSLVVRLMNTLTPEVVENILGDLYLTYSEKYQGNNTRLKKEAAAKLLLSHIKEESIALPVQKNLISRIFNWITNLFGKLQVSDINLAINEANNEAALLASLVVSEDVIPLIDTNAILNEAPLYRISEKTDRMEEIVSKLLEVMSKKLMLESIRTGKKKYDEKNMKKIKELQELIDKKNYTHSSILFLLESQKEIKELYDEIKKLKTSDIREDSDLSKIRKISRTLRSVKEFSEGYEPIIKQLMSLPALAQKGEVDLTEEDAEKISLLASETFRTISNINENYEGLRFNVVYNFLKVYWGEDKLIELGKNKGLQLTLELLLKHASKDINGLDRWISSMSDASDPLLSLVDKAVKMSQARRDDKINTCMIKLRAIHKKLLASGVNNTEFMFEKDENGKPTGRIISDIDFVAFNRDRDAYIKTLKDKKLKSYAIKAKVEAWEKKHMEKVNVPYSTIERTEMLPAKSIYGVDRLSKLTAAQREYYNEVMEIKALMDDYLPARYTNTYNAILIRNDSVEAIAKNISDPKKAYRIVLQTMKDKFVRRVDDIAFGEDLSEGEKRVLLNFQGKPFEKLPVYYTTKLEDMDRLSMDFTGSMAAYIGMATNYMEMNQIVDVLELTRDLIKEREVSEYSGDSKLKEVYTVLRKKFNKAYTTPASNKNIGDRIDDYYASVIYGKQKKDEGTWKIPETNKEVDKAQTLDAMKSYTGAVGLGLNLFSAISNVTIGKMQILIEACSGEYFNMKNSVIGKKNYYSMLPKYMAEINSTLKTNKLALLIDKFDAMQEFYNSLREKGLFNGPMSRIFGKTSLFILHNLGEHYLHCRTMLAMLDAYKVKDGDKTISIFDAFEVNEENGEYSLKLKDGITNENGTTITEDDLLKLKLKIGKVNQSLNGAFNDEDRGAIHRYALGRLAMLFRQWMPAHYYRRFAAPYYDAQLELWREGYYRTAGKFALNLMSDITKGKFQLMTNWNLLSEHEKANLKRALSETAIFVALTVCLAMLGPAKDKKGAWFNRMLIYNLKRMKLETGASFPLTTDFLNNIWTILQSPAAAIKSFNNIGNLLEFWNMFNEIESGRYKGWSEYERDLVTILPVYGHIRKAIDITDEDYMFAIFNK